MSFHPHMFAAEDLFWYTFRNPQRAFYVIIIYP